MITATCTNNECQANATGYNIAGDPTIVKCGECGRNCETIESTTRSRTTGRPQHDSHSHPLSSVRRPLPSRRDRPL